MVKTERKYRVKPGNLAGVHFPRPTCLMGIGCYSPSFSSMYRSDLEDGLSGSGPRFSLPG